MKRFLAALLLAFGLLCPCADAQQGDALRSAQQGDDLRNMFGLFKAQAEKGSASAQSILGSFYEKGTGVEKDYSEAVKWYRKAAEQNHPSAQSSLGSCYEKGQGVEKNYTEAYAWYNLASATFPETARERDALEKTMSPQQVGDAQKRTRELRAIIEANEKAKAEKAKAAK